MGPRLGIYNWSPVSWEEKRWASSWTFKISLQFAFPETGDRWAPICPLKWK